MCQGGSPGSDCDLNQGIPAKQAARGQLLPRSENIADEIKYFHAKKKMLKRWMKDVYYTATAQSTLSERIRPEAVKLAH